MCWRCRSLVVFGRILAMIAQRGAGNPKLEVRVVFGGPQRAFRPKMASGCATGWGHRVGCRVRGRRGGAVVDEPSCRSVLPTHPP